MDKSNFCFNNSTWGGEGIKTERRCQQDQLCGRNEFNNIYNIIPITKNQSEVRHSGVFIQCNGDWRLACNLLYDPMMTLNI